MAYSGNSVREHDEEMVEELCDASSCTLSPAPSSGTNSPASSNNGTNSTSGACCRSTPSIATTAATNTLPPCRVCGEKASGFHYGVNTCEACKGFFRRSLQRKDQYKCLGSGQCKIGIGRRSNCPSCRYLKCLSVGMSKSAIKTGRYTHEKRTQDILEVKQMQFSQAQSPRLPPSELGSWKSQVSPPTPAQASSPSPASSIVRKPNSLRQESSTAFDPTSPSAFESSPVSAIQPTQLSVSDTTPHSALKSNQTSAVHPTHSSTSDPTSDSTPINSNQTSAVDLIQSNSDPSLSTSDPPSDTVPTLCSQIPPTSVESTTIMIWTPRPGSSFTPEPAAVHPQSSSSPCQREASTGNHLQSRQRRGYAHDDRLPSMMPLVTPMPPMPPTPPEDTEDYDSVIAMLVDAHKKYIISHTFTPFNVLRERQIKYFEDFQRKEEMFGSLSTLPQEQYMEIFEKTGMDVDNRQEMITFFASQMEAGMKRYINFVKNIPCFSELPIDDQAALIKAARYEFWFCGSFPGYNGKLKVVCLPSGKNLHIKEMCKLWERDFVLETFRLAETFHKLPLFPDEFVLIKCLCVLFADRCELRNQPKVEDIQWKLVQCLLHLLRKNHSSSTAVFAKIIDRLTELRSLTEWNYKIARNLQIWPAIHQSPLMVEMLSV